MKLKNHSLTVVALFGERLPMRNRHDADT